MAHNIAKLNRLRWMSGQIARLAAWADGHLRKIWIIRDSKHTFLACLVRLPLRSNPLLRELLSEAHSLFGRMSILCKEELWHRSLALGPAFEVSPAGVVRVCGETEYRRQCIENLLSELPWVSQTDFVMFLRGFEAAKAIQLHNENSRIENEASSFLD